MTTTSAVPILLNCKCGVSYSNPRFPVYCVCKRLHRDASSMQKVVIVRCQFAEHGICQMATRLANRVVPIDQQACGRCQADLVPMALNRTTAALACLAQKKAGVAVDKELSQIASGIYNLAGHKLERYIHKWLKRLRITPPANCGCDSWINKMNKWGVQGSLEHLDEIADALYDNLRTTYLSGLAIAILTKPLIKRRVRACLLRERS